MDRCNYQPPYLACPSPCSLPAGHAGMHFNPDWLAKSAPPVVTKKVGSMGNFTGVSFGRYYISGKQVDKPTYDAYRQQAKHNPPPLPGKAKPAKSGKVGQGAATAGKPWQRIPVAPDRGDRFISEAAGKLSQQRTPPPLPPKTPGVPRHKQTEQAASASARDYIAGKVTWAQASQVIRQHQQEGNKAIDEHVAKQKNLTPTKRRQLAHALKVQFAQKLQRAANQMYERRMNAKQQQAAQVQQQQAPANPRANPVLEEFMNSTSQREWPPKKPKADIRRNDPLQEWWDSKSFSVEFVRPFRWVAKSN